MHFEEMMLGIRKGKKKGGADYEKYMKYKFKYLKLKELFKNAI